MSASNRNDIKELAQKIELLAQEIQVNIDKGGDLLLTANELVRNNATFVFTLGEVYALEQASKKVAKNSNANYYNVRNKFGRFTSKN